jgi:hypothetical protein
MDGGPGLKGTWYHGSSRLGKSVSLAIVHDEEAYGFDVGVIQSTLIGQVGTILAMKSPPSPQIGRSQHCPPSREPTPSTAWAAALTARCQWQEQGLKLHGDT